MASSSDDAIRRWSEIVRGITDKPPLKCSNIVVSGDRVFSYGSHFELARPLRDKRGKIVAYLLNGDTYSVTTSKHQSQVRNVMRYTPEIPSVIIPFSALDSAGVDRGSVRIVDVSEDRWETTRHHSDTRPEGAFMHRYKRTERVRMTDAELEQILDDRHAKAVKEWEETTRAYSAPADPLYPASAKWHETWLKSHPEPPKRPSLSSVSEYERFKSVPLPDLLVLKTSKNDWSPEITVTELPDGSKSYDWETRRHWLGESLIRARVSWRTRHECRACNGTGRAIGPAQHDRWGWPRCPDCDGAGGHTTTHHRWATYLSGFDHQESTPLYFFCELPYRAMPRTVAEAYEALKPDPVQMAEQMGRHWSRQGDIFAIPTTLDAKALKARGARIERRAAANSQRPTNLPYILNTNHTATEVAYLPGGLTLARGLLYHDPAWRRPDHARRKMGDGKAWHIVIKNTVPTSGRR